MINGVQSLALLFSLTIGYFTFLNFKRREFTLREFIAWEIVWLSFFLVTLFPQEFALISDWAGAWRPLDLFTIAGFVVTLSISFYTYSNLDRVRKKLEKTIRDLALSELKSSNRSGKSKD